jgi:lipopolysaccharide biosynthesis glycosyltransferase
MASSLLLLGITGDMAFAAGCLLLALRRHSPGLAADLRLYTDTALPASDAALLRALGADLMPYEPPDCALDPAVVKLFSRMCLARFEAFLLLDRYRSVVWLDVDTAIQDDISELFDFGPLSLALEDPHFTDAGTSRAGINIAGDVPGFDAAAPNYNSGVLVVNDDLPDPARLHRQCMDMLQAYGPQLRYPDQAVFNLLVQTLLRDSPELVRVLPHDRFNAHPRNPVGLQAAVMHAFGAYKLWDDGLTRCSFPEWSRDYLRWLKAGGSPWQGTVDNAEFLEGGPFFMLRRLFDSVSKAQQMLDGQGRELDRERELRKKLERIVAAGI